MWFIICSGAIKWLKRNVQNVEDISRQKSVGVVEDSFVGNAYTVITVVGGSY